MKKRIISLLLCMVMCVTVLPITASATDGSINDTITWTLQDGTLTVSGTGAMPFYSWNEPRPWSEMSDAITAVVVGPGVTVIGANAFSGCNRLVDVTISDSVEEIYPGAFGRCNSLTEITIPAGVTYMENAFENSGNLQAIYVADDNQYFSAEDGVLFNKDKTELLCYPSGRPGSVYSVPESVHTLQRFAFRLPFNLEQIIVGETVTQVKDYAFNICTCAILFKGSAPSFSANAFGFSNAKVYYPSNNATWHDVAGEKYGATGLEWKDLSQLPVVAHARHEWVSGNVYLGASLSRDLDCTCGEGACSLQVTEDGFHMAFGSPYDAVLYLFKPENSTGLVFADDSVNNYARLEDLGDGVYKLSLAANGDWCNRDKDGRTVYDRSFAVPVRIMYGSEGRGVDVVFSSTAAHTYRGIAVAASKEMDVGCIDDCGIGEVTFDTNDESLVDTGFEVSYATSTDLEKPYIYLTTDGKNLSLYNGYERFAKLEYVKGYTYKLTLETPRAPGVYQDDRWGDGTYVAIARTAEGADTWDPFRVWFTPAQHSHSWGDDHRCTVCGITDPAAKLKDLVAKNPGAVQAESGSGQELQDAINNGTVTGQEETTPSVATPTDFGITNADYFLAGWNTKINLYDGNHGKKLGQLIELGEKHDVEYEITEETYNKILHKKNVKVVRRHIDAYGNITVTDLGAPNVRCTQSGSETRYYISFASDRFSDFALVRTEGAPVDDLGGSLRRRVDTTKPKADAPDSYEEIYSATDLRFGFKVADVSSFDNTKSFFTYTDGVKTYTKIASNIDADGETNLVLTNVPTSAYGKELTVTLTVVRKDGVTVTSQPQTLSVQIVAEGLKSGNDPWAAYALKLLEQITS